ncbi:hypothetical protein PAMP_004786 [Pampus punctatissimus]
MQLLCYTVRSTVGSKMAVTRITGFCLLVVGAEERRDRRREEGEEEGSGVMRILGRLVRERGLQGLDCGVEGRSGGEDGVGGVGGEV